MPTKKAKIKIYSLSFASEEDYSRFGVAYVKRKNNFDFPANGKKIPHREVLNFVLKDGDYADYLANDLGCRLVSQAFKLGVEESLSSMDKIQWLKAIVWKGRVKKPYFVIHFYKNLDVLNHFETKFVDKLVIRPVFDAEKVSGLDFFGLPKDLGPRSYVSHKMKTHLMGLKLSGFSFYPSKVH